MLRVKEQLGQAMKAHATRSYPEECCGLMLGRSEGGTRRVESLIELKNSSSDQRTRRYLVSPEEYLRAENDAREQKLDVLGMYHSHPDHPARPSQFDLDHALPWWSYVIIAVDNGVPSTTTSWLLREDRTQFDEEQLIRELPD